jgi:hypothetical protein
LEGRFHKSAVNRGVKIDFEGSTEGNLHIGGIRPIVTRDAIGDALAAHRL